MNIKIVDLPLELKLSGVAKPRDPAKSYGDELIELLNGVWPSVKTRRIPTTAINHSVYGDQGEIFAGVVITIPPATPGELSVREIALKRYAYYKYMGSYAGLPLAHTVLTNICWCLVIWRKSVTVSSLEPPCESVEIGQISNNGPFGFTLTYQVSAV
jgi:hypothetical protein